jgi:hypothetical protein
MSENRIAGPLLWLILGCALASGTLAMDDTPNRGSRQ